MAKLKTFDVSDVERGGFTHPAPGLYTGKIVKITEDVSKNENEMLTVSIKITNNKGPQKEFKGVTVRTWILTDSEAAAFKLGEFVDAVGFKNKGTVSALIKKALGSTIQFKIDGSTYNGEYAASVGRLMPLVATDATDEDDDGEPEEDEDEDDDEAEEEEDEEDDEDDYNNWSKADLVDELETRGLEKTGGKSALVKRLIEDDEEAEDPFS